MTKAITSAILNAADTKALIGKIKVSGTKLDAMIQQASVSALDNHTKHGDTSLVNMLVLAMPKSGRKMALVQWFQHFGALAINEDKATRNDAPMLHDKARVGSIPELAEAIAKPFWDFKANEGGNVWDTAAFMKSFGAMLKKAEGKLTEKERADLMTKLGAVPVHAEGIGAADPLETTAT